MSCDDQEDKEEINNDGNLSKGIGFINRFYIGDTYEPITGINN